VGAKPPEEAKPEIATNPAKVLADDDDEGKSVEEGDVGWSRTRVR